MEKFIINGAKSLKGEIEVRGAKNAATPILAAALLTKEPCTIDNLPLIGDVFSMIETIKDMGAKVDWLAERKVKIQAKDIDPTKINKAIIGKLRSSILFLGSLIARFDKIKAPHPGGDLIGARPVDTHLKALQQLGADIKQDQNYYYLSRQKLKGAKIVLSEFSVTGTENVLMAAALASGKTQLKMAATEPHVQDLGVFLKKMGVSIKGIGTHTLEIQGQAKLKGANHVVIPDPIEAGTFLILGAATKSPITVKNVEPDNLDAVLNKLKEFGVKFETRRQNIKIIPQAKLKAAKVVTRIYPGLPTDLQAPFGVLATQAHGTSLIFDTMYEGRLRYLSELKKMGANAIMADPHRALITGPTPLYGKKITSFDIRAGATLVIAALLAQGKSEILNAYQVDRGYEKIEERLQKIGAEIKRL